MAGNCIFISPNYPEGHWRYAEALRSAGWCVLAIGDAGYETFPSHLRCNIDDYYRVGDLHDTEQVERACAYMLWKHGPIARVETVNAYWSDLADVMRREFVHGEPAIAQSFAAKSQTLAALPGSLRREVTDADDAATVITELGLPLEARRSDEKSGDYIRLCESGDVELLEFSDGERYTLEPVNFPGGATVFCRDGKAIAASLYSIENGALIGVPMSEYQRAAFGECALAIAADACAIVHINAIPCAKGIRGKAKKGELMPAGGSDEPLHEYAVDLLSAEHGRDIRELWAADECEPLERERLACVVSRRGEIGYRQFHEQVLRRLAPRLWYHNTVMPRDRERFGDYVYVFTGETVTELRREMRFVIEQPAQK